MNQDNHEEHIARLESKVDCMEKIIVSFTLLTKQLGDDQLAQSGKITACSNSIGQLWDLIYTIHPEFRNPDNTGAIHSAGSQIEIVTEALADLRKRLESIQLPPPPPGS